MAHLCNNYEKRAYDPVDEADQISCRPDFAVGIYPGVMVPTGQKKLVQPELTVTSNTPPTFLVQAEDDSVHVENSIFYYLALKNAHVPAELHLYSKGGHGYGLRPSKDPISNWPKRAEEWLRGLEPVNNSPYAVQLQMERALADCGMETQDKIFDLYVDFLASSVGLSTATGLAQVLDGDVSHDQITRMLARHPSCGADLWRLVKRTVRRLQRDDGVLLLDDTISHKPYTDENELVTWHYDHARNRSVKGIRFISALYHVQGVSVPVSFEVVTKPRWKTDPKSGKPRRRAEQTRGDIYRRLLKALLGQPNTLPLCHI